jgi:hypothetical protein
MAHAIEALTLQENALAAAMVHHIGDTTLHYSLRDGKRYHEVPEVTDAEILKLIPEFAVDPKESLAWVREALMRIAFDERLTGAEKDERLDRYLDAYIGLTVKLDHAAFPPTPEGIVAFGVPDYIPDGFVDMGGERSRDVDRRHREMIKVDKKALLDKYKPLLKELFSYDFEDDPLDVKKRKMFNFVAQVVYSEIPYTNAYESSSGDVVNLHEMDEGICRHQALVFQVLAQAAGLKSRLLKCHMSNNGDQFKRHAANMGRVDDQWYIIDASSPDYAWENDRKVWRVGSLIVDGPPRPGETRTYEGVLKNSHNRRTYKAHDDMYWYVDKPV